ncbi:hypothetical protein OS493_025973 [Desmophyllum pertusum]|uniref:MACPF domain-containing protein n=1 Tax=Desmophyllum pertusum TaxID=174260 RepID=A0A9W9YL51_9CNID|nr:hypothetical protein OS493_025973 [Desmophyllum pertusum]
MGGQSYANQSSLVSVLVGIACATRLNSHHKTKLSLHKESLQNSKRNLVNQQLPQAAKPFLSSSSAPNFAKIQRPNGFLGAGKGNVISRYGQHATPAAQPNTPKKNSRPVQMHQVPSAHAQYTSNQSGQLSNAKTNFVSKPSPLIRKVPNVSEAVRRPLMKTVQNSADSSPRTMVAGWRRNLPMKQFDSPLAAADVQGAVVEKGIEVMGKMVDKQLQIIDDAQQKAEDFLKKEIKLDIVPDKGWKSEDMFVPPGYHLDTKISEEESAPKEMEINPFSYPAGLGSVMMNGCYGTGYQEGDPCYVAKWTLDACLNMIDGAAFMGVGFDGRGDYSPESRRMSIVQRSCAGKATYDDYDVPDTMNVHGIYDTKASMTTFESRSEFQTYLQQEAGVSGSFFGFYAGSKQAWGQSTSASDQQYMALLSVDINRYEIFLDEVKPESLSLPFLKEFMSLPTSYFAAGASFKYQDFIQRWGTHYIKSSDFGGQLQIRKTMSASEFSSKMEFATEMEKEYKTLFGSVGSKSSTKGGSSQHSQSKTTSTTINVFGGSHEIATILSDAYAPTFKNDFKDWLVSIPKYPKPFLFKVGPITNLLDFRANDLFPNENVNWGCEGNVASLQTEINANGDKVKYFETPGANGTMKKHYCVSDSRKGLEDAIKRRRISLQRAIEIYMEEGFISITDFKLPVCSSLAQDDPQHEGSWQQITSGRELFSVLFDMKTDLIGVDGYKIPRNMSRLLKYEKGKWLTGEKDGSFHLFNAFDNGKSGNPKEYKMSIMGLVLSYNEERETLELLQSDLKESRQFFPDLHKSLVGKTLASIVTKTHGKPNTGFKREKLANRPCNVKWSNTLRFDPTDSNGKCLHFTASTAGKIFVVFSTLPNEKASWYYIEIGQDRVAIYKVQL